MDHHGLANTHHGTNKYGGHHGGHGGGGHGHENGHDNFSDFVSLVCQQDAAAAAAGQHLAASAAMASGVPGAGGGHPGPVRSPYSAASGYLPPTIPPTSIAAQHAASRSMANVRATGESRYYGFIFETVAKFRLDKIHT